MDHTGNPTTFPETTKLIVGPGFKKHISVYPADPDGLISQSDLDGRLVEELEFDGNPKQLLIGGFKAIDYFEDGSFYLLQTPGVSAL